MFSPLRRPGDYQNHAADTPATPRGSSSPLNALSPIADAVRHATKEGTRDWHRMLGSFSRWTQPYSSEPQEQRQRSQRSDTNGTKEEDSFTDAAESSTSLTPDLERHSITAASNGRYREGRPPVQYRESLFGSPPRSVISAAASTPSLDRSSLLPPPSLTPSSTRSASIVEDATSQHIRPYEDDDHVSMAYRSPSRSISSRSRASSYKRHVMDPKRRASSSFESVKRYTETLNRGRLGDEIHRLDQLQRRLDTIQQVSSELAVVTRDAANEIRSSKRASPSIESSSKQRRILDDHSIATPRRWSSRRSISNRPSLATEEERPSRPEEYQPFTLTSPISSPLQSTRMTPMRESPTPSSRPSYASVAARSTPLSQKMSENKSSSPVKRSANTTTRSRGSATPNQLYRNVLSDITKAKLRPTATYRRASGTNIRNPFWEEIQAAKAHQQDTNTTPMRRDTTPAVRRVSRGPSSSYTTRTPVTYPNWEEEGEELDDEYWPRPRRITEKLMSLAQEDKEEREAVMRTPGSLGDELEHAMRKSEMEERQRERAKAESMAFSLDPLDDQRSQEDKLAQNGIQRIDGDEWMFDGRQYMVNEKKT